MKISGHNPYTRIDSKSRDRRSNKPEGAAGVRTEAAQVAMSDTAKAMSEARAPEKPDADRIERLRAAIANGELKIDAQAIAARMMEEEY